MSVEYRYPLYGLNLFLDCPAVCFLFWSTAVSVVQRQERLSTSLLCDCIPNACLSQCMQLPARMRAATAHQPNCGKGRLATEKFGRVRGASPDFNDLPLRRAERGYWQVNSVYTELVVTAPGVMVKSTSFDPSARLAGAVQVEAPPVAVQVSTGAREEVEDEARRTTLAAAVEVL